jgi:hypothetical protein
MGPASQARASQLERPGGAGSSVVNAPLPTTFTTLKGPSCLSENLRDRHIVLMSDTPTQTRLPTLISGMSTCWQL